MRATSSAVLPPPYTTTRRPSCGFASVSMPRRTLTASRMRVASRAGMSVRFATCAPTARKRCVEPARLHRVENIVDARVELERDAHVENALHFRVEHVARQPVFRNAEPHHAARERPCFVDRDLVPEPREMVGRRESRRSRADHQYTLTRRRRVDLEFPALLARFVAEETLDSVYADGLVERAAIARVFAGVITNAPHQRRQRIVPDQFLPRAMVFAALRVIEPALDILARRARVIARRQAVDVDRPVVAPGTRMVGEAGTRVERDRERFFHAALPNASPNLRTLRSAIAWIAAIVCTSGALPNRWAKRRCSFRYSSTGTRRRN